MTRTNFYHLTCTCQLFFILCMQWMIFSRSRTWGVARWRQSRRPKRPNTILDWCDGTAYGRRSRRMEIPKWFRVQLLLWFHSSRVGGITRTVNRLCNVAGWPTYNYRWSVFMSSSPLCNKAFNIYSRRIGPRKYVNRKYSILVEYYSRYMGTVVLDSIETPSTENSIRVWKQFLWISEGVRESRSLWVRQPFR